MSTQANSPDCPTIIRRSDRGLTISGTRVTLYALMEYLRDGCPAEEIRQWLGLSEAQLQAALDYITAHRSEVDAEYAEVVREAEERQRYWAAQLQQHLERVGPRNIPPEKAALYAKLADNARTPSWSLRETSRTQCLRPPNHDGVARRS